MGLNLTLGYAGQISLAQGAFVGIGAYTVALLTPLGVPFFLAFLAAGLLCFAVGWGLGYPGAARAAPLPRFRHARFHHARFPGVAQRAMAHERHLRHHRHAAPDNIRLEHERRARFLFLLSRHSRAPFIRNLVDAAFAMGPRLRCLARKSDPRAVAWSRHAPLHADGLCHRLEPGRTGRWRSTRRWCNSSSRTHSRSARRSICC